MLCTSCRRGPGGGGSGSRSAAQLLLYASGDRGQHVDDTGKSPLGQSAGSCKRPIFTSWGFSEAPTILDAAGVERSAGGRRCSIIHRQEAKKKAAISPWTACAIAVEVDMNSRSETLKQPVAEARELTTGTEMSSPHEA